jgi:hypothetical protein
MRAPVFMAYNHSAISKHCLPWGRIGRQPMPRPFSLAGPRQSCFELSRNAAVDRAVQRARTRSARKYGCGAKVTIGPELHAGGETMLTTACCPWQHRTECKIRGYGQMISAVECREHAVECREMSERAPSPRVRDILIDMAREAGKGWRSKLSIARRRVPNWCCAINFDGSCRRQIISTPLACTSGLPRSPTTSDEFQDLTAQFIVSCMRGHHLLAALSTLPRYF